MSENGTVTEPEEISSAPVAGDETVNTETTNTETTENAAPETVGNQEDISYHTVEKEGTVSAIWEMQERKHLRTIDPRSSEGKHILELFETAA